MATPLYRSVDRPLRGPARCRRAAVAAAFSPRLPRRVGLRAKGFLRVLTRSAHGPLRACSPCLLSAPPPPSPPPVVIRRDQSNSSRAGISALGPRQFHPMLLRASSRRPPHASKGGGVARWDAASGPPRQCHSSFSLLPVRLCGGGWETRLRAIPTKKKLAGSKFHSRMLTVSVLCIRSRLFQHDLYLVIYRQEVSPESWPHAGARCFARSPPRRKTRRRTCELS